ncbi:uncharacterized protein LOC141591354 [Silene latifolia]|uniref:uncharacterized protein LOC141591354 n=1 Tax=Silene latifolia TaxID=37657 RepID=UPI003D776DEA
MSSDTANSVVAPYAVLDDPLYISNTDQPTLKLTEIKFNGNNSFLQWKREVYNALIAKNKEGFIDGTCKTPDKTGNTYHQWRRCDLLVMRWLTNSVESHIGETLKYSSNAKEMWEELLDRYGQTNGLEIYSLKKELGQISQENTSLIEYYSKMKTAWESIDELDPIPYCSCGAMTSCTCQLLKRLLDRDNNSKLIQFLMGLNHGYESVKTNVLTMDSLPPLNKALRLLQKIEKQRLISEQTVVPTEVNAYASARSSDVSQGDWKRHKSDMSTDKPSPKFCNSCQKPGHTTEECYHGKPCDYCGKKGHPIANCYIRLRHLANKSGRGRGRYNSGGRSNVYHKRANNADIVMHNDNPLDVYPAGISESPAIEVDKAVVNGIVQNVVQQVYKVLADKSSAGTSTVNFAGPYQ